MYFVTALIGHKEFIVRADSLPKATDKLITYLKQYYAVGFTIEPIPSERWATIEVYGSHGKLEGRYLIRHVDDMGVIE